MNQSVLMRIADALGAKGAGAVMLPVVTLASWSAIRAQQLHSETSFGSSCSVCTEVTTNEVTTAENKPAWRGSGSYGDGDERS